jgi:hypothetical protein
MSAQLEVARQAGYIPSRAPEETDGSALRLPDLDITAFKDAGLIPLSPDGETLGSVNGDALIFPYLETLYSLNPETGELSVYQYQSSDGTWRLYQNHGGPTLKVPVTLPTGLADLVGVYSVPDKDPALVAAKLLPDGSIKITPIVFTESEEVTFGMQSVIIDGQEVLYNQLTNAWEPLPAPFIVRDGMLMEINLKTGAYEAVAPDPAKVYDINGTFYSFDKDTGELLKITPPPEAGLTARIQLDPVEGLEYLYAFDANGQALYRWDVKTLKYDTVESRWRKLNLTSYSEYHKPTYQAEYSYRSEDGKLEIPIYIGLSELPVTKIFLRSRWLSSWANSGSTLVGTVTLSTWATTLRLMNILNWSSRAKAKWKWFTGTSAPEPIKRA